MKPKMTSPGAAFRLALPIVMVAAWGLATALAPQNEERRGRLHTAKTWMYQIDELDKPGAIEALAKTSYPLLVVEPGNNKEEAPYKTADLIKTLRTTLAGKARVLLAYVAVGEAENWRTYWGREWVAPTAKKRGNPDFLVTVDPDGWRGCYPVAYWDKRWKDIWLGRDGLVAGLARLGFDGVYLDWVEAYDDEQVRKAAKQVKVKPELEMIQFVEEIRAAGRAVTPDFLVVPQNAPYLLDAAPDRYAAAIDALAVEDTWFRGEGDAAWDSPKAGDLKPQHQGAYSTNNRLKQYRKYLDRGLPVFSVDYCISTTNAAQVYGDAKAAGLRPLVTRVSLSKLTQTPPPPGN